MQLFFLANRVMQPTKGNCLRPFAAIHSPFIFVVRLGSRPQLARAVRRGLHHLQVKETCLFSLFFLVIPWPCAGRDGVALIDGGVCASCVALGFSTGGPWPPTVHEALGVFLVLLY